MAAEGGGGEREEEEDEGRGPTPGGLLRHFGGSGGGIHDIVHRLCTCRAFHEVVPNQLTKGIFEASLYIK